MKCLLIRPGQQPEEAVISDDLQSIQRFLGGPVEAIPFSLDWAAILSNANGPFHEEAEPNRIHKGKMIYGPFSRRRCCTHPIQEPECRADGAVQGHVSTGW